MRPGAPTRTVIPHARPHGGNPQGMAPPVQHRPAQHPSQPASTNDTVATTAHLFRQLRAALGISVESLAWQIGAEPSAIRALESGALGALPPWPETERLVRRYLALAHIQPDPVLAALAPYVSAPPRQVVTEPAKQRAAPVSGEQQGKKRRWPSLPLPAFSFPRLRKPSLFALRLPLIGEVTATRLGNWRPRLSRPAGFMLAAIAALAVIVLQTSLLEAAARYMPRPISGVLVGIAEQVRLLTAPTREGLRWIEVDDPRSRRADKLKSAKN